MKAVFLVAKAKFEIAEIPKPAIEKPDDVLIKIKSVGVCGSDRHYFIHGRIGSAVVDFPFIIGHETAGVVCEVGSKVGRVKSGDRVIVEPGISCGKCEACLEGLQNLCPEVRYLACGDERGLEGCLKEYLVMPEDNFFHLPDNISFEEGTLIEPLSISLYSVNISDLEAGQSAAVFGSGPMGLTALASARAHGAALTFATDLIDERVEMARALGADHAFNPRKTDVVEEIMEKTGGRGVDVAFEAAGEQETMDHAVKTLKLGGRLVIIGIPATSDYIGLLAEPARRKGLVIKNVRRQVRSVEKAIELVRGGMVNVKRLITHRFTLEETGRAFEILSNYRDGVVKAVINY
ncbi:MAG: alcohol dehydrogenase catalytic domain-containing protein [Thermoplasmata archaeon]|nr:alcohol dehydrogenase catalytic domain-containing protein [Thermoplasmata archaeon]